MLGGHEKSLRERGFCVSDQAGKLLCSRPGIEDVEHAAVTRPGRGDEARNMYRSCKERALVDTKKLSDL